jgi:predicted transcriptional regulator
VGTISIRISEAAHERLRAIAQDEERPLSKIAEDAIAAYERERRWQKAETAMARVLREPDAAADYLAEVEEWDGTLMDGLGDSPYSPRPR